MQALEREIVHPNWITILLIIALVLLAALSSIDRLKLKKTVFALFDGVYIEEQVEEKPSFFSAFNLIILLFTVIITSIALYQTTKELNLNDESFLNYGFIFLIVLGYFILKRFIEFLFKKLFQLNESISFFQQFKNLSLYSINFGLFIIVIINSFSITPKYFLLYTLLFFFLIRFTTIIIYNKNLILSKLFYFILYLCALEIAPLVIAFKLTP